MAYWIGIVFPSSLLFVCLVCLVYLCVCFVCFVGFVCSFVCAFCLRVLFWFACLFVCFVRLCVLFVCLLLPFPGKVSQKYGNCIHATDHSC